MDAVQKISNTHDDIMNVMIANPFADLRQLSALTGYSIPWLSRLMNSDIFRSQLAEKKGEVVLPVLQEIPQLLTALGRQAVEKMAEKLETVEDPQFVLDTFDKVMKANGFAPGAGRGVAAQPTVQQNNFFISREELAEARRSITMPKAIQLPVGEAPADGPFAVGEEGERIPLTIEG